MQTSLFGITESVLGECEVFEEKGLGDERFNFFTGCPKAKTATIILRGGGEQFLEETDRSVHDALCVVRSLVKKRFLIGGGGAPEAAIPGRTRRGARSSGAAARGSSRGRGRLGRRGRRRGRAPRGR